MLEVFEGVLPVLLLGAHVLLQQVEDVTGLRKQRGADGLDETKDEAMHLISSVGQTNIPQNQLDTALRSWHFGIRCGLNIAAISDGNDIIWNLY